MGNTILPSQVKANLQVSQDHNEVQVQTTKAQDIATPVHVDAMLSLKSMQSQFAKDLLADDKKIYKTSHKKAAEFERNLKSDLDELYFHNRDHLLIASKGQVVQLDRDLNKIGVKLNVFHEQRVRKHKEMFIWFHPNYEAERKAHAALIESLNLTVRALDVIIRQKS